MTRRHIVQRIWRRLAKMAVVTIALAASLAFAAPRGVAAAGDVAEWNLLGLEAAVAGGQNPIVVSRTMAMMHLAVHDALNGIERRYEPW